MTKLNRENFRKLIQSTLDADPKNFTMKVYSRCGTPACVLGNYAARSDLQSLLTINLGPYAPLMLAKPDGLHENTAYWSDEVCEHFGINAADAEELFAAPSDDDEDCDPDDYEPGGCGDAKTPEEAVHFLTMWMVERCLREDILAERLRLEELADKADDETKAGL
jgi:hypothetical protein